MQNRISKFPGRVRLTPVDGQENVFDLVRADEPEIEGTPINKATLLSDDVAVSFGLSGDMATPDGAFKATNERFLRIGNLHVWKYEDAEGNIEFLVSENRNTYPEGAQDYIEPHYELKELTNMRITINNNQNSNHYVFVSRSDRVTVSSDGSVSLVNSTDDDTFGNNATDFSTLQGKYITVTTPFDGMESDFEEGKVYFIPTDATKTYDNWIQTVSKCYEVIGYPESKSGTYTYMGQIGNRPCVQTGSWTGTGTYGESKPNMLTFDFVPQFVMVYSTMSSTGGSSSPNFNGYTNRKNIMVFDELTTSYTETTGFRPDNNNYTFAKKSADGKTWYWYSNAEAYTQYNSSGMKYFYLAVGKE